LVSARRGATIAEGSVARLALLALTALFLGLFLLLPLIAVFQEAFSQGVGAYLAALADPDALAAIRLTLLVAAIAVPLNLIFGLAASWAIAKFTFPGRSLLVTLIDLPFSVSPVIAFCSDRAVGSVRGWLTTTFRSSSPCPVSFLPLFSSPFPLSPAS
jgi:sulfate transport system permease protein